MLIKDVADIMLPFGKVEDKKSCEFANGHFFLKHSPEVIKAVKTNILNLISKYVDHKWVKQTLEDDTAHPSWVGRLIGETDLRPFSDAWYRISNIDTEGREWGQPYFVLHPEKSKALEALNKSKV